MSKRSWCGSWLSILIVGCLICLTGCRSGRYEFGTNDLETYGKPGETVWATVAMKTAGVWNGPGTASFKTISVRVGTQTAAVLDVLAVTSTSTQAESRVLLYTVPEMAPGRYPVVIGQLGSAVTNMGSYYLVVNPR